MGNSSSSAPQEPETGAVLYDTPRPQKVGGVRGRKVRDRRGRGREPDFGIVRDKVGRPEFGSETGVIARPAFGSEMDGMAGDKVGRKDLDMDKDARIERKMKVDEVMKQLNINNEQELNEVAVILAEHCTSDANFPGLVAKFEMGVMDINLEDLEQSIGNDSISWIFVNEGVIADFYEHAEFGGRRFTVEGPEFIECLAKSNELEGGNFNDTISSIQLTYPEQTFTKQPIKELKPSRKPYKGIIYGPDKLRRPGFVEEMGEKGVKVTKDMVKQRAGTKVGFIMGKGGGREARVVNDERGDPLFITDRVGDAKKVSAGIGEVDIPLSKKMEFAKKAKSQIVVDERPRRPGEKEREMTQKISVVVAEHCPRDARFPGYVGVFEAKEQEINVDQLVQRGILDDTISFVSVNVGWEVELFESKDFQGESLVIRGPMIVHCLEDQDFGDRISSIRIRKVPLDVETEIESEETPNPVLLEAPEVEDIDKYEEDSFPRLEGEDIDKYEEDSFPRLEGENIDKYEEDSFPWLEGENIDKYEAFEGGVQVGIMRDRVGRPKVGWKKGVMARDKVGIGRLDRDKNAPTRREKNLTKLMKQLNINNEQELNEVAVILAEHCTDDKRWPGRAVGFGRGITEVGLNDTEQSIGIGNDTVSFVFVNEGVTASFYEHAGFQGRSFQVRGPKVIECLRDYKRGDFHDKISSIRLAGHEVTTQPIGEGTPGEDGTPGMSEGILGEAPEIPADMSDDSEVGTPGNPVCAPTSDELEKMKAAVEAKNSGAFADAYEAFVGRVKQEESCKSFFDMLRPVIALFGKPPNVKFLEDTPAVYERVGGLTKELMEASEVVDSNPACAPNPTELTAMQTAITAKDADGFANAFYAFSQRISGLQTECDFRVVVKPVQDLFPSGEAMDTFVKASTTAEQKLKDASKLIRPVVGLFLLSSTSNPVTDLPDMKQVFMESQMNPADGFLPYTPDAYDDDATQFNVTHNGKRYVVRTNSYSPGNHAVTLFIDPKNNPGLTFWAAQIQKSNNSFYYKGYEGKMVVGDGDWVEIQYPEAQVINTYTLHFNMMTTAGNFNELLDVPPTGWIVLGSNDGAQWDVLHENNMGKTGWLKAEWSEFADIRDGSITQTIGSTQPYTHYRLLVTRWGDDLLPGDTSTLRRLDRWVLGTGSTKNAPEEEPSEAAAPPPPPTPPPTLSTMEKMKQFISDYKWYVLAAVLLLLFLVYYFMFR